jgi:hypothetical protein
MLLVVVGPAVLDELQLQFQLIQDTSQMLLMMGVNIARNV